MKNKKRVCLLLLSIIMAICILVVCTSCKTDSSSESTGSNSGDGDTVNRFYNTVKESQENLDIIADTYYEYWYKAIYKDSYNSDINVALLMASYECKDEINKVKGNDELISIYFATAKKTRCQNQVKEVMTAYSEYYEFVINVSGSFSSYSRDKEIKKKALATALRNLQYEL